MRPADLPRMRQEINCKYTDAVAILEMIVSYEFILPLQEIFHLCTCQRCLHNRQRNPFAPSGDSLEQRLLTNFSKSGLSQRSSVAMLSSFSRLLCLHVGDLLHIERSDVSRKSCWWCRTTQRTPPKSTIRTEHGRDFDSIPEFRTAKCKENLSSKKKINRLLRKLSIISTK